MSVIQNIRDKYARISVIAIALALLGFLLMDAFVGRSKSLFSGSDANIIGRVNGKKIDPVDFDRRVKQQENYLQSQPYSQGGEANRQQAIDAVWNVEVTRVLMTSEISKLGMQVGKREINEILFGANPPEDLKKQFTDPQTGQYNAALAQQQINEMKRKGTVEQKNNFNNYLIELSYQREIEKYNSLITNTINFPRWFLEKQNADNSQIAKISFVREPYSSIPDSSIKISDKEIEDYISKNKDDYKQEESRSIAYVTFSAQPTATDSAATREKLIALKTEFDTTKDAERFLASQGVQGYYKGYISGKTIQRTDKDSIFKLPAGAVYGPYLNGTNYELAKLEGVKQMPDTARLRHILISTAQQNESGQMVPVRDTATAKKMIDSIQGLIRGGQGFDSVCAKLSEDGTKDKGGVYENVPTGQMVEEFNDFIFTNPVGTKGVVKTIFGYHYIEILSQKGSSLAYKIAYLPSQIIASNETDNNASNQANLFAGDSRDLQSFDANYEKNLKPKGIQKSIGPDIKPKGFEIMGLGASRSFIKEIYKAKQGEVLQPARIGDNYVVAVVTDIFREGTQRISIARIAIEPILRKKKKAEQLIKKLGKITTLEAIATSLGKQIEAADSLRMTESRSAVINNEPRISGAAFNPANIGKVVPEAIEGANAVYMIRVDNVTATAVDNANVAEQRKSRYQQGKQMAQYNNATLTALRNNASITDKRADRY